MIADPYCVTYWYRRVGMRGCGSAGLLAWWRRRQAETRCFHPPPSPYLCQYFIDRFAAISVRLRIGNLLQQLFLTITISTTMPNSTLPDSRSRLDPEARRRRKSSKEERVCSICSQAFRKAEHLARHVRSHTKEKPFECSVCGRTYVREYVTIKWSVSHDILTNAKGTPCYGTLDLIGQGRNHCKRQKALYCSIAKTYPIPRETWVARPSLVRMTTGVHNRQLQQRASDPPRFKWNQER